MSAADFKATLEELGFGYTEFAVLIGTTLRTIANWVENGVPPVATTLVLLLRERPELVRAIRDITGRQLSPPAATGRPRKAGRVD